MDRCCHGCTCRCVAKVIAEQRLRRFWIYLGSVAVICLGMCLVAIAYQLLPDSTHQHALKSLRVFGYCLSGYGALVAWINYRAG